MSQWVELFQISSNTCTHGEGWALQGYNCPRHATWVGCFWPVRESLFDIKAISDTNPKCRFGLSNAEFWYNQFAPSYISFKYSLWLIYYFK